MIGSVSPRLLAFFRAVVARRVAVVTVCAVLVPAAAVLASRIESDASLDRLVVRTDPDYRAQQQFRKLFPEKEQVLLLAEAPDPFAGGVIEKVRDIETRLRSVPRLTVYSALDLFERARAAEFGPFVRGTDLFRRQGLVGPDFLGLAIEFEAKDSAERDEVLVAIDAALAPFEAHPEPLRRMGRVGGPYVDAWIEGETARAGARAFPLFGLFVVVITLALYRSWRTLAAILLTLLSSVALTVGFGQIVGFAFTIVSSLVPLTVLITCTAALVYLQSRYVEKPPERPIEEHQLEALANKFLATTASMFAAAIGFAALGVSKIRPIREMGLWVGAGIFMTWILVFTLFPALQRLLRVPARASAVGRTGTSRLFDALPGFTWRWRRVLLPLSVLVMLAGCVALVGVPGRIAPLRLETDALDYVDQDLPIVRDTRHFEKAVSGLSAVQVWVSTPPGRVLDPEILRGLEEFSRRLEADPRVGAVEGPTTALRFMRYVAEGKDRLPDDPAAWPPLAARLEGLLMQEPDLRRDLDVSSLAEARLTVVRRGEVFATVEALRSFLRAAWDEAAAKAPALRDCRMQVVGEGILAMKIAEYLVPTLTQSFVLTAAIIFAAFLVVFRSGAARLMAMIPSLFAILAMFLVMRVVSIPLNVATILIASTVLGASENDQIHFFYHFQERRAEGVEAAMRHALLIAGRAILFATLINAGGFLALVFSGLPPMRQFGILASSAFVLSMIASLTFLPAALWTFSGEKPRVASR
jgi:predicted RND superfamily exporter protein